MNERTTYTTELVRAKDLTDDDIVKINLRGEQPLWREVLAVYHDSKEARGELSMIEPVEDHTRSVTYSPAKDVAHRLDALGANVLIRVLDHANCTAPDNLADVLVLMGAYELIEVQAPIVRH